MNEDMPRTNLKTHLSHHEIADPIRSTITSVAYTAKCISSQLAGETSCLGADPDDVMALLIKKKLEIETCSSINKLSYQEEDPITLFSINGGRYAVTVDRHDGRSLVDVDHSIGTVIGIHDGMILRGKPGRETLVAAMYIVYGTRTTLVYTAKKGVYEFVLDRRRDFLFSKELKMKEKGNLYSPGGRRHDWLSNHAAFIKDLEVEGYKLRYSGELVPDFNQILSNGGGIITVPNDDPRFLFEEQPLALIAEQAGGLATNGIENILDIVPESHDQKCPFYIGSRIEVEKVRKYLVPNRLRFQSLYHNIFFAHLKRAFKGFRKLLVQTTGTLLPTGFKK